MRDLGRKKGGEKKTCAVLGNFLVLAWLLEWVVEEERGEVGFYM